MFIFILYTARYKYFLEESIFNYDIMNESNYKEWNCITIYYISNNLKRKNKVKFCNSIIIYIKFFSKDYQIYGLYLKDCSYNSFCLEYLMDYLKLG